MTRRREQAIRWGRGREDAEDVEVCQLLKIREFRNAIRTRVNAMPRGVSSVPRGVSPVPRGVETSVSWLDPLLWTRRVNAMSAAIS